MRIATLITLLALISLNLYSQGFNTASLTGDVKNPEGYLIPDAHITLISQSNGAKQTTKTDTEGNFYLDLKPDTYTITIEAQGFTSVTATVNMQGIFDVVAKITLKIGEPGIADFITEPSLLPLDNRNFIRLMSTIDGVDNSIGSATGGLFNVVADINEIPLQTGRTQMNVPFESIQAGIVGYDPFSSNIGSPSIDISLNRWQKNFNGSAFFNFRNNNLQSRLPFLDAPLPSFDREFFGGSLSGRIKDNLFFNFGGEQRRVRGTTTVGRRNSACREIVLDFARTSTDNTLISAGINFSKKDLDLTGRYLFEYRNVLMPGFSFGGKLQTPENFELQKLTAQQFYFTWSSAFSKKFNNQLGFGIQHSDGRNVPLSAEPQIVYPSLNTGANFLADQRNIFINTNVLDNVAWRLGSAVLRIGFSYDHYKLLKPSNFNMFGTGIVFVPCDFPGESGCPGAMSDADIPVTLALINRQMLINGFDGFGKRGLFPPIDNHAFDTYGQYELKRGPNLALSMGLRWDYDSDVTGVHQINQYGPGRRRHQKNKVGTRLGVFWLLKRLILRGGHGFYFDQSSLADRQLELLADGSRLSITRATGTTLSDPFATVQGNVLSQIFVTANNFKSPFASIFNFTGKVDLGWSMSLTAGFGSQRWAHLTRRFEANIQKNGDRLNNNFGSVIETRSVGHSVYDDFSLTFELDRRGPVGTLYATYILARSISDANEPPWTINTVSDPLNPKIDRGPSSYDSRHRFNLSWFSELPSRFNLFVRVRAFSSMPFDILQNHDFSGAIRSGFFRLPGLPHNAGNRQVKTGADLNAYIDAFNANPSLVAEHGGPIARVDPNIKFNSSICNFDLSLSKFFGAKDNTKGLRISGDVFNLFNTKNIIGLSPANSSGLGNNLEQPNFGKPLGVLQGGIFGNYSSRAFQITARITF